jgi:four helix bundle protein
MGNYRDLQVWQRAQSFAVRIDRESRHFARGNGELADQLRRAALSISTNLAEGACRGRDGEFLRFIAIAIGSAGEADSLLLHATHLGAFDSRTARELDEDLTVIRKMLFKLRKSLQ